MPYQTKQEQDQYKALDHDISHIGRLHGNPYDKEIAALISRELYNPLCKVFEGLEFCRYEDIPVGRRLCNGHHMAQHMMSAVHAVIRSRIGAGDGEE